MLNGLLMVTPFWLLGQLLKSMEVLDCGKDITGWTIAVFLRGLSFGISFLINLLCNYQYLASLI